MSKDITIQKNRHMKSVFKRIVNQVKQQAQNNVFGDDELHPKLSFSIMPFVLELNFISKYNIHFLMKYFERELINHELYLLLQRPNITLNEKIELRLFIYHRNIFERKLV